MTLEQALAVGEAVVAMGIHHAGIDAKSRHGNGHVKHQTATVAHAIAAVDDLAVEVKLAQSHATTQAQMHLGCHGQTHRHDGDGK